MLATRPGEGRIPTMPQKLAGLRSEPPRSEPCASQAVPVASATAEPPEEPAAERDVFQGFSVRPKTSLKVLAPAGKALGYDIGNQDTEKNVVPVLNIGIVQNNVDDKSTDVV